MKKLGRPRKTKSKLWETIPTISCSSFLYMVIVLRCYIVKEIRIACNEVEFKMHKIILKKKYPKCEIKILRFKGVLQYTGK